MQPIRRALLALRRLDVGELGFSICCCKRITAHGALCSKQLRVGRSSNPGLPAECNALIWNRKIVAGAPGFEPGMAESKSAALRFDAKTGGRLRMGTGDGFRTQSTAEQ